MATVALRATWREAVYDSVMPSNARQNTEGKLQRLERAIRRARLAMASERIWPRVVPILSIVGIYIVLSWLGYWRIGGDFLRMGTLGALALALLWSLIQLVRISFPNRLEAMRRVELVSGLPHRPARGLTDKISAVADDVHAKALWAAEQARLLATLQNLRAGPPRPAMPERDPQAFRFAVPVLLVVAFAVGWGEWTTRLGEAFMPVRIVPVVAAARIDAWIDPPAYTRQAPIFLSRRTGDAATQPVSVPEGSKLTVRVVSRDAAEVTLATRSRVAALVPAAENPSGESDEAIRSYETTLDRDATVAIRHADNTTSYALTVVEDRPPTIARGPLTVNQSGSFQLAYTVTDDYGVTEGSVTFNAAKSQAPGAHPLVEPPKLSLRVDRGQSRNGTARADGRLEAHPYAGLEVTADAFVKDAAGQEARPADPGTMTLPARPFYHPIARALIEQRQVLALDANTRQKVAIALDAMTIAPEKIKNSSIYLGIRVGYRRLVLARTDDELHQVLDYLWQMARSIEDGDMSDAAERLAAARQALEQALKDGASEEEIARLMNELRQAMNDYLESFRQELAERGLDNLQQMPPNQDMQMLSDQDLQEMLDRIEELAKLGDMEAAQELLSQLQQMLDNMQMAQPGQMSPMDEEAMRQMDELSKMMREQQRLMDETFEMNQGRRPGDKQGQQGPLSEEEFERLMRELQQGQGDLAEQLKKLLEGMQGQQGEEGENGQDGEGQGQQGQNGQGMGPGQEMGRTLGRAGRAMGDASRSLGEGAPGDAYGYQGEALDALREGLQGMMEQMYANQPGMNGQQMGGRPQGDRDPLGRPQRTEGPDLGESVKVPDEIDVERARRILEAIRERLGERFRPRYELDYLERLLNLE
jgi:uncharacterized protein (TIGR02302 family)